MWKLLGLWRGGDPPTFCCARLSAQMGLRVTAYPLATARSIAMDAASLASGTAPPVVVLHTASLRFASIHFALLAHLLVDVLVHILRNYVNKRSQRGLVRLQHGFSLSNRLNLRLPFLHVVKVVLELASFDCQLSRLPPTKEWVGLR